MATILDSYQATAAAWEVERRIAEHCKEGGMLEGLHTEREGTIKVTGADDLPALQRVGLLMTESIFAGAHNTNSTQGSTPVQLEWVLAYRITTDQEYGFVRLDPETQGKEGCGLMEWLALIMDAIETVPEDTTEKHDALLNKTCSKPVAFRITEVDPDQFGNTAVLEVVITAAPTCRGERHYTIPPSRYD